MLYTAQYRYPGMDRLDITVKGQDRFGKLFAPTWAMVKMAKAEIGNWQELYTGQYYSLLIERWKTHGAEMFKIVEAARNKDITVVCFCPAGAFCHRHLLVKFLQHNYAVEYGGERTGF
jgi:uncharacterized protein YeaO (DUF488 family)